MLHEEDDLNSTPKKEKDVKKHRSLRRSRTSSAGAENLHAISSSPASRGEDIDFGHRTRPSSKHTKDLHISGERSPSPGTSPRTHQISPTEATNVGTGTVVFGTTSYAGPSSSATGTSGSPRIGSPRSAMRRAESSTPASSSPKVKSRSHRSSTSQSQAIESDESSKRSSSPFTTSQSPPLGSNSQISPLTSSAPRIASSAPLGTSPMQSTTQSSGTSADSSMSQDTASSSPNSVTTIDSSAKPTEPSAANPTSAHEKHLSSSNSHAFGAESTDTKTGDAMDEVERENPASAPSTSTDQTSAPNQSTANRLSSNIMDTSDLEPEPTAPLARLIRVHGARNNIHCSLVPRLASSLNKSDCFILDTGAGVIYTWKGKSANMFAKSECSDIAVAICQAAYHGSAQLITVEHTLEPLKFWESLATGRGEVADSDTTGITSIVKFFQLPLEMVSNENDAYAPNAAIGAFSLVQEGRGQIRASLLSSYPLSALDTGFEIIIYDNTKNMPEPIPEQQLIDVARRYKKNASRPSEVRITVVRASTSAKHPLITHYVN